MVKSNDDNGSGSVVAPFLKKCYEMVDDESTDSIISWGPSDDSFVIWAISEFSVRLLPKYFKHSNFSSFIRQLNIYGFRKIDTDRWEFANDGFIRGRKHLLKNICRRKNSQGSEQRKSLQRSENPVEPFEKTDHLALWKEVENLKIDNNALSQELLKVRESQETADNKLLLVRDRIRGMEKSQQQMLSFLVMAMQNPGFLIQLLQPRENNWRMTEARTLLEEVTEVDEPTATDKMMVRYQPLIGESPKPSLSPKTVPGNQMPSETCDGMILNVDFLKMLMDENQAPFSPLDLHSDGEWERLLLASPFLDKSEDAEADKERHTDSDMEIEPALSGSELERLHRLELLLQEDEPQDFDYEQTANGPHLDFLTDKMGLLDSDNL